MTKYIIQCRDAKSRKWVDYPTINGVYDKYSAIEWVKKFTEHSELRWRVIERTDTVVFIKTTIKN